MATVARGWKQAVLVVLLGASVTVVGCSQSAMTGDKMGGDKMMGGEMKKDDMMKKDGASMEKK
jgi:pentapeptide MXKDX repeat protein